MMEVVVKSLKKAYVCITAGCWDTGDRTGLQWAMLKLGQSDYSAVQMIPPLRAELLPNPFLLWLPCLDSVCSAHGAFDQFPGCCRLSWQQYF